MSLGVENISQQMIEILFILLKIFTTQYKHLKEQDLEKVEVKNDEIN